MVRELWELFKTHLVVNLIALFVLALGLGVGLPMMIISTPHNGLSVVILTLTIVIALLIYDYILYKKLGRDALPKRRVRQAMFYLGIAFVVAGFTIVITQMNFKSETQTQASTQPSIATSAQAPITPVFPIFVVPKQTQYLVFSYGNSSFRFTVEELLSGGRKFFIANNYEPFKAYIVSENSSNNLYVDVNTYGNNIFPPLQIVHNQLVNLPQGWDVNFLNGYALELVNDKQKPILQLIYDNQYHVIVNGFITYPNGIAYTNGQITYIAQGSPESAIDPILLQKSPLKRLFKYPSSQYQSQRVTP